VASRKSTTQCNECGDLYGSEKGHRAVCTRKEVPCIYPDSSGNQVTIVLRRGADHNLKCVRCGYSVRKDQNIKVSWSSVTLRLLAYKYQKHTLKCQVAAEEGVVSFSLPDRISQHPVQDEEQVVVGVAGLLHELRGTESHPRSQPVLEFETNPLATPTLPQLGIACQDTLTSEPRTAGYSARAVPATSNKLPIPLNKNELLIVPDEHSIVDDPLLRCTPYIVNTKYLVLICTDCRHCVNPARSAEHIRKHHSHCKIGAHFATQVISKYPGLVNEEIRPPEVIEPVFGLAIPEEKYTICSRCLRGYRNISSWRHHGCERSDVNLEGRSEHFSSHVQSFFKGRKVCYFCVRLPELGDKAHNNDFDLFQSGFREVAPSEDEVRESDDYRELNQFLLKEGWIKHISGYSDLFLLVALPKEGNFQRIGKEVIALMSNIQGAIGSAGYHLRRLIGRRPS